MTFTTPWKFFPMLTNPSTSENLMGERSIVSDSQVVLPSQSTSIWNLAFELSKFPSDTSRANQSSENVFSLIFIQNYTSFACKSCANCSFHAVWIIIYFKHVVTQDINHIQILEVLIREYEGINTESVVIRYCSELISSTSMYPVK